MSLSFNNEFPSNNEKCSSEKFGQGAYVPHSLQLLTSRGAMVASPQHHLSEGWWCLVGSDGPLLHEKFGKLPKEIVNIILSYSGVVSYRSGKYINRICPSRYQILNTIPRPTIKSIDLHDETFLRLTVNFISRFKNICLEKNIQNISTDWSGSMIFNTKHSLSIITNSCGYHYKYKKLKTLRWYVWNMFVGAKN